ncbi:MAG TPA: RsmD family RNA methyltransferase [Synergistaceae bacterium]|nr:RsmD family RNA methyltransferase [Synergistaceae bacterium]HQK25116.1 RsmD family RNA methyltransferase [Synergistaceae bacterium]
MKEPKEARPTSAKVLQALFNILGPLHRRSFLDLFAGTGRVSAAAWQRGARPVVAVELRRPKGEGGHFLEKIGEIASEGERRHLRNGEGEVEVFWGDVRRALRHFRRQGRCFDVIFADPPYQAGWVPVLLALLVQGELPLDSEGVLVLEHSVREPLSPPGPPWITSTRTYGETALSFFHRERTPQEAAQNQEEDAPMPRDRGAGEEG